MKKILFSLLFFSLSTVLHADYGISNNPSAAVAEAQQHLWEVNAKLNDAVLSLNLAKLDWQRGKLTDSLTQAQTKGDTVSADMIQQKIADVDHKKDVEKQRHDLNAQLLEARQQNDQAKIDNLNFQLKGLQ